MKLPVAIQPGFFLQRPRREEPRVGAGPTGARVKRTLTAKPSNPRAKYAMPVVVIAAAIGTFAAGAAAFAAATGVIGMVAAGAMMVGAAMTIVGTVTNRPNLVKWGGFLSLAGGIATVGLGMMNSAASGADAIAAGENVGTAAGGLTTDSGALAGTMDAVQAGENVGGILGDTATAAAPPDVGLLADVPAPIAPSAPGVTAPTAAPAPGVQPTAPAPLTADATSSLSPTTASQPTTFSTTAPDAFATPQSGGGFFDGAGKWIDKGQAWVKANPELARAGLNAVGGIAQAVVPKPQSAYEKAATESEKLRAKRLDPNSSWWKKGGT